MREANRVSIVGDEGKFISILAGIIYRSPLWNSIHRNPINTLQEFLNRADKYMKLDDAIMKEEIGIKFEQDEFVLVGAQLYKKQFVDIFKTQKKINIRDIKLQLEEVQNVKFVGRDEFYKMIENDEMVLSVIQRYNLIKDKLELDW